jgi:Fe-S cluster biogenesis protein NfuA
MNVKPASVLVIFVIVKAWPRYNQPLWALTPTQKGKINMDPVQVLTEFTPNPNSLKFNTNREILTSGTAFFSSVERAAGSPLAKKIFGVESIAEVFIGRDFVTVTRAADVKSWAKIISSVTEIVRAHLESGEPAVVEMPGERSAEGDSDVVRRIIEVLDERIRPAVARDGGDIIFDSYDDGIVRLHLQGSCSSCPSSTMTLKVGVESMLKELVPEVREVIQV